MTIEEAREFWRNAPPELAHVRGPMPDDRFDAVGVSNMARVVELVTRAGKTMPLGTVVEWGCGGGANAVHMVDECDRYIGVDVEPSRGDAIEAVGGEFVCIDIDEPEEAERATASADLFFSSWCFIHFDSRDYGRRVLRSASNMLSQDGLLLVQAVLSDGGLPDETRPYGHRWSRACGWNTRGWLDDVKAAGFAPMRIQRDDAGLAWCSARKG